MDQNLRILEGPLPQGRGLEMVTVDKRADRYAEVGSEEQEELEETGPAGGGIGTGGGRRGGGAGGDLETEHTMK
jgi:hypothetical protein